MTGREAVLPVSCALLVASSGAGGVDVQTRSENFTLEVNPRIQTRVEMDSDGPPGAAGPGGHASLDFSVRLAQLLVRGTAYKQFTFGILLTAIRLGERGNLNVSPFIQDLRIGYVPLQDVNLEIGLLYMPLSHAALETGIYQSALEGPGDILFYNNARNLRETGVQLRALLLDRRLLVRGGFYEGARSTNPPTAPALNPNGMPLSAGMLRLNVVGEETGYAYPGIYLDGKTRISVGVGAQYQPHSGSLRPGMSSYDDYIALAADVFADVAITADTEAVLTFGGYRFDYGAGQPKTGNGLHGELGYRWGRLEPQGNFYWYNSDTKKNSFLRVAGGLNVFLHGHEAKIQVQFASVIANARLDTSPALHQIVVQTQLAF